MFFRSRISRARHSDDVLVPLAIDHARHLHRSPRTAKDEMVVVQLQFHLGACGKYFELVNCDKPWCRCSRENGPSGTASTRDTSYNHITTPNRVGFQRRVDLPIFLSKSPCSVESYPYQGTEQSCVLLIFWDPSSLFKHFYPPFLVSYSWSISQLFFGDATGASLL